MNTLFLGIIGGGTVGAGVAQILSNHEADIHARLGVPLRIRRVIVRDLEKKRDPALDPACLSNRIDDVLEDPDISIVIEVMGGVEESFEVVAKALRSGKHVVTANKALLAERGTELFQLAKDHGVDIAFEASVGGGIPIIRSIREALASDNIERLYAIINGTSNFIVSAMAEGADSLQSVVEEAQSLGYAEADPSMDVDGIDAAQKLSILASLAFGVRIPYTEIPTQGLRGLLPIDFELAQHFGFTLKPLAIAQASKDGVHAAVTPALLPQNALLASVNGVFNAVFMEGSAVGPTLLYGKGAGMLPTAVSVVSDVIEVGRNILQESHGRLPLPLATLPESSAKEGTPPQRAFFVRVVVEDAPGALAEISQALSNESISIRQMIQSMRRKDGKAFIGLTTYPAMEHALRRALTEVDRSDRIAGTSLALPILEME